MQVDVVNGQGLASRHENDVAKRKKDGKQMEKAKEGDDK